LTVERQQVEFLTKTVETEFLEEELSGLIGSAKYLSKREMKILY